MEKDDAYEDILDLFQNFGSNELLFTLGHSAVGAKTNKVLGLKDADDEFISTKDLTDSINKNKSSIGLIFIGACRSCEILEELVKTDKIFVAVGFTEELERGKIGFAQGAFTKALLDGKTIAEAVADSPQKLCVFYGKGYSGANKLADIK
jgi:hypothetical protein